MTAQIFRPTHWPPVPRGKAAKYMVVAQTPDHSAWQAWHWSNLNDKGVPMGDAHPDFEVVEVSASAWARCYKTSCHIAYRPINDRGEQV
jgi:hypothetical protein